MVANAMNKQDRAHIPVIVRVSEQRALGIMAEDQSWEEFAWLVDIPTDIRVLDEWTQDKCRFVTIDWSGK